MHVSYGLDDGFPPSLPFEIALGDILAKAIAMSAQALQSLPKDQRLSSSGRRPYTAACWSSLNMPYHQTSRTTKTTSSGKRPMPSSFRT